MSLFTHTQNTLFFLQKWNHVISKEKPNIFPANFLVQSDVRMTRRNIQGLQAGKERVAL
jgi:hypothetical protein